MVLFGALALHLLSLPLGEERFGFAGAGASEADLIRDLLGKQGQGLSFCSSDYRLIIQADGGTQERVGRASTGEDISVVGSVWFARYQTFWVGRDQTIEPSVSRTSSTKTDGSLREEV